MGKPIKRPGPYTGDRYTEKAFQPYALAIGQLALSWNGLHEALAKLFWEIMGGGWLDPAISLWNAGKFDRPKRELLKAVVATMRHTHQHIDVSKVEDIEWLLDRANALEDDRNNAVHSPLLLITGKGVPSQAAGVKPGAITDIILNNPRALRLAKKNLLTEYRWCRDQAVALRDYAMRLDRALSVGGNTWPRRPSLPNRGQKKTRSLPARQDRRK